MQRCSLCGGRVVDGRCEECGMPIPPESRYARYGEEVHTHEVNGEPVLHRVRLDPRKRDVPRDAEEGRRPKPRAPQSKRRAERTAEWIMIAVAIVLGTLWGLGFLPLSI